MGGKTTIAISVRKKGLVTTLVVSMFLGMGACSSTKASPSHDPQPSGSSLSSRPSPQDVAEVNVPRDHSSVGVVVLHSLGHGIPEVIAQGWTDESNKRGFVAIYPSRGSDWNAGLCCGPAARSHRGDVGWLAQVISAEVAKYHLRTVYLSGNSNGGMMVERLVAEMPQITMRFAVWASAPEMPRPGQWQGNGYLFHGSADSTVPLAGGHVRIGGSVVTIRPGSTTGRWLIGSHLLSIVVPKRGHAPPPNWPDIAWSALTFHGLDQ